MSDVRYLNINKDYYDMKHLAFLTLLLTASISMATEQVFQFNSPAFNGNGYSTHILSIEQIESQRKQKIKDERQYAIDKAEREAKSTNLAKFLVNVESRIYANLSKQMVDAMFADCGDTCANSGSADVEGNNISWIKDPVTGTITLTITGEDGTVTEIEIPGMGEFNF